VKHKLLSVAYGIRFNTYLYPLSLQDLVGILEKKGYEISSSLPFPLPAGRLGGAGELARKGKTVVQIDTSAQVLTINDISVESAMSCFDEIANLLQEDYGVDVNNFARFYSFVATYEFQAKKQAYEKIAKAFRFPIFDEIEEILGQKIWPFGLKFGGADLQVNSENWFDVEIRPNLERNDSYVLQVVFRNSDRARTQEFIKTFEKKMGKVVNLISR